MINMNETELMQHVCSIQKIFEKYNIVISDEEIASKFNELVTVYKVPELEARRSVVNALLKKYNLSKEKISPLRETAAFKTIAEITALSNADTWVSFTGKVIQLWEKTHDSVAQVGLIGDESGIVKFMLWENSHLPLLELNKTYQFKNTIVKLWNGKVSVDLNKATSIEPSEKEIPKYERVDGERVNEIRTVSELDRDGLWTDLKAKVIQIFENTHESIAFAGVLGDETGTARFTIWKTADVESVEIEKSYLFSNAIVKEWNSNFSIEVNRIGKLSELEEDIEVRPTIFSLTGCVVDIQAGSGLVKRCPDCNKVMSKGQCGEHGKVKGKYDLRIKAVLDDGSQAREVIINCDLTQKILGFGLDEAIQMATETLDPECVNDVIKKELIGKYCTISGLKTDRYIIAESVEPAKKLNVGDVILLKKAILLELEAENEGNEESEGENKNKIGENETSGNKTDGESNESDFEKFEQMLENVEAGNYECSDEVI